MLFSVLSPCELAGEVLDHFACKKIWRAMTPMKVPVAELAASTLNYLTLNEEKKVGDVAIACEDLVDQIEREVKKKLPLLPRTKKGRLRHSSVCV